MIRLLIFILFAAVFLGCSNEKLKTPAGILPPDTLSAIQADFYIIEAAYNLAFIKKDSLLPQYEDYYNAVLKAHNTRKTQVDSSIKFYAHRIDEFNRIYTRTLEIIEIKKINNSAKEN